MDEIGHWADGTGEERLVAWPPVATIEARQAVTEHFVIEGGRAALRVPSAPRATRTPPCPSSRRALLTDRAGPPVERPAHPRRRGDGRAGRRSGRRASSGRRRTTSRSGPSSSRRRRSTASSAAASAPRSCSPARCWRAAGKVDRAAARRRRHRPPPHRHAHPGVRGARRRGRPWTALRHRPPSRACKGAEVFLDEPSVTGTENAVMAAVLAPGTHLPDQHRLRAARPGPLPDAREDGRAHRGHRLQHAAHRRASSGCPAATTASAPTTSRSRRSSASRPSRAATSPSPASSTPTCARSCTRSGASA